MSTQWRVGLNGAVGLDYNVLPFLFRLMRIPRENQLDVLDDIRVMESTVLKLFAESKATS